MDSGADKAGKRSDYSSEKIGDEVQAVGLPRGGILCVVGARPNFMKMAPILRALEARAGDVPVTLVHTGQHYGHDMQDAFFAELGMPVPDVDLEVGSNTHAVQTAEIMRRFEPVVNSACPRAVVVVGDVNSTLACALVAVKMNIPVVHVEAGLRSRDRSMPEEINRILTDQISDIHFTTERGARDNLTAEGIAADKIHFVGNVMIDTLRHHQKHAIPFEQTLQRYRVQESRIVAEKGYALVTMHRPSNVDDPDVLESLIGTLEQASARLPLVFPVHPRTKRALEALRLPQGEKYPIVLLPALGYLEVLGLMTGARIVLTDSGGMQEETTAIGVCCLTLRDNTERPITIDEGTNILTGNNRDRILSALDETLATGGKSGRIPELWDGHAGDRIAEVLCACYSGSATGTGSVRN